MTTLYIGAMQYYDITYNKFENDDKSSHSEIFREQNSVYWCVKFILLYILTLIKQIVKNNIVNIFNVNNHFVNYNYRYYTLLIEWIIINVIKSN